MKIRQTEFKTSLTTEKHEAIAIASFQWQWGTKKAQKTHRFPLRHRFFFGEE
jgi:hypothetical protein